MALKQNLCESAILIGCYGFLCLQSIVRASLITEIAIKKTFNRVLN